MNALGILSIYCIATSIGPYVSWIYSKIWSWFLIPSGITCQYILSVCLVGKILAYGLHAPYVCRTECNRQDRLTRIYSCSYCIETGVIGGCN